MSTKRTVRAFGLLTAAAACSSASAHHSYAQFDACVDVTIEGEIEEIAWANPHIVIMVEASDGASYRVEWFALNQLSREGLSTDTLAAGDHVAITGARHKDPEIKVLTLLSEISRPERDWKWARARVRDRPAACEQPP